MKEDKMIKIRLNCTTIKNKDFEFKNIKKIWESKNETEIKQVITDGFVKCYFDNNCADIHNDDFKKIDSLAQKIVNTMNK